MKGMKRYILYTILDTKHMYHPNSWSAVKIFLNCLQLKGPRPT